MIPDRQITEAWDDLKTEAPYAMKTKEEEPARFAHFKQAFSDKDQETFSKMIGYLIKHLIIEQYSMPTVAAMLNVYELVKTREYYKASGQKQERKLKTLYDAVQEISKRLDLPVGFSDNNWHDRPLGDDSLWRKMKKVKHDPTPVDYTKVKSLKEVLQEWWRVEFEAPAIAEHRRNVKRERLEMTPEDRPETDLEKDESGKLLCYYCFNRVYHPFTTIKNKIVHDQQVLECENCGIKYKGA